MVGLEKYCKSDLLNEIYLQTAKTMLEITPLYQSKTLSKKLWNQLKKVVGKPHFMKPVVEIIKNAVKDFNQAVANGKVTEEEKKYVNKQIEIYNKMVKEAYIQAEKEGLVQIKDTIGDYQKNVLNEKELNI